MDIFNSKVHETFGCYLFNTKDNSVQVKKIHSQLKQVPQLLNYESSSEENDDVFQPKLLKDIYMQLVFSSKYPKEYLAAPVCEITHMEVVSNWEANFPIPTTLNLPIADCKHIIFNYPERSPRTNQCEMRTFDYTHILNNLRFHVSNDAIHGISAEAFISVSEVDHDVLPRAIVEDKLDRQNCAISQKFFSKEVQKILQDLGHEAEVEFTEHTRNWFRACDEHGMDVQRRLTHLQNMYNYLLSNVNLNEYPPPTTNVFGIPIKTFEAMLHCISTRFSLFVISSTKSYNTRAVSTLAVESFFSDLARYEFSGLATSKAVDIPNSHIVYVNTIKHDPLWGFESTTSTRDNYPT